MRVLIKGYKSFIQDQKLRNVYLCLQKKENHHPQKSLKDKGTNQGCQKRFFDTTRNIQYKLDS